jgi:large subunit ribosomal protein L4
MKIDLYKIDGTKTGKQVELNPEIFEIVPNDHSIYLTVKLYNANQRQGTHKTKVRNEVRGGGRKPWRQKGRGTARAGSVRSPIWIGGGTIFGPKPRDYGFKLPQKVKKLAFKSALSYKAKGDEILVVEDFTFEQPKTKQLAQILESLQLINKKTLLLTGKNDQIVYKSGNNIPKLKILEAKNVSTFDILNSKTLLLQQGALQQINMAFSK